MRTVARSVVIAGLAFLVAAGTVAQSTFSPGPAPKSDTRIYEAPGSDFKLAAKGIDADGKPRVSMHEARP